MCILVIKDSTNACDKFIKGMATSLTNLFHRIGEVAKNGRAIKTGVKGRPLRKNKVPSAMKLVGGGCKDLIGTAIKKIIFFCGFP